MLATPLLISSSNRAEAYVLSSIPGSRDELSKLRPKCIFVDGDTADLETTIGWIREDPFLFATPVIAMLLELRDGSFVRAYRKGADDVILRSNLDGMMRRIENLKHFDPRARPAVRRGRVLVSHQVDEHRRLLGRVLRQACFDVHFATDADEVVDALKLEPAPELVVVSSAVLPVERIADARRVANALGTRFVVVSPTASAKITLDPNLARVATISEKAPHDHLLFVANDLLRDGHRSLRKYPRYLFDTICGFRPEGAPSAEYGLTYNISETGIYVRTLDPPSKGASLSLELKPPGMLATVQLQGTVVWVATPGDGSRATPPGFGLRIEPQGASDRDVELYSEAFHSLAKRPNRFVLSWRP